jgi:hypothetical protein
VELAHFNLHFNKLINVLKIKKMTSTDVITLDKMDLLKQQDLKLVD